MNKYGFLLKIDSILNKLGLNLSLFIEHSIKVSSKNFITDRVNFKIPSEELNYKTLLNIVNEFDFNQKIYDFIDSVYELYGKDIKYIYFGFSEGNYEIYFEKWIINDDLYSNMTNIISYDLSKDMIYEYFPFDITIDSSKNYLINNLVDFCKTYEVDLSNNFIPFGYLKDNGYCHIGYFNSNHEFLFKLKNVCNCINDNEQITNWFYGHQNISITLVGYSIVDDILTISIYYK